MYPSYWSMVDDLVYGDLGEKTKAYIKRKLRKFGKSYKDLISYADQIHGENYYNSMDHYPDAIYR